MNGRRNRRKLLSDDIRSDETDRQQTPRTASPLATDGAPARQHASTSVRWYESQGVRSVPGPDSCAPCTMHSIRSARAWRGVSHRDDWCVAERCSGIGCFGAGGAGISGAGTAPAYLLAADPQRAHRARAREQHRSALRPPPGR